MITQDLIAFVAGRRFGTVLIDPPWRFTNRTGKMAPEHKRLSRYTTMAVSEIAAIPVGSVVAPTSHLYLWVPNALLPFGLQVMEAWGFTYKSNIVWHKIRKDGGSDGRGVGFYFRNVTELVLFGVHGKNARTLAPGRRQVNFIATQKREHSRKPDELYPIIEGCSRGPYLELFARGQRKDWQTWGNQADPNYRPNWPTYKNSASGTANSGGGGGPFNNSLLIQSFSCLRPQKGVQGAPPMDRQRNAGLKHEQALADGPEKHLESTIAYAARM